MPTLAPIGGAGQQSKAVVPDDELEERAQDVDASDDPQMVRPAPPEKRASFAKDTMDRLGNSIRNEASRRKSRTWQLNDLEGNKALLMRQDSDWVS